MNPSANLQKQTFDNRLQRIHALHGESAADTQPQPSARPSPMSLDMMDMRGRRTGPARRVPKSGVLGVGIGLAIMLAANVTAVAYSGPQDGFFAKTLGALGPFAIAGLMLFVVMIGLGLRDKPHVIGITLGIAMMYICEPYMAWMFPDLWVRMYSPDHVDTMLIQSGLREPVILTQ